MTRAAALAALGGALLASCQGSNDPSAQSQQPSAMTLSSTFADGQAIPPEFTCDGAGRSPPMQWSEPPPGTQSFALIVDDPDAPGGTFRHWGVYDLPASARQIDSGAGEPAESEFKQAGNDFGEAAYGPPCPPAGDKPHHYHVRLMALDLPQLPGSPAKVKDLLEAADGHTLGSAELVATYQRQ